MCSVFILDFSPLPSLFQTQAYKGVARDPYSGDVAMVANTMKKELGLGPIDGETPHKGLQGARVHQGVRDLHESSFSLSGRLEKELKILQSFNITVFGDFYEANWCSPLRVSG